MNSKNKFQTWKDPKIKESREKLLNQNNINDLLKTHFSTKERFQFYPKLKSKINSLKPKSILDLACGLNPIALATPKVKYFASDINKSELSLIKKFFKKNKIRGKIFQYDLKSPNKPLPETDLCLILKTLDIIEKNPHPLAKKLIQKIKCKSLIISFSTQTLSGKPMKNSKRLWLRKLLKDLNLKYEIFSSDNEIFYLIKKETN